MESLLKEITSPGKCTGCMVCVDSCNKDAIVITSVAGIQYPNIDTEKCVNCNACKNVCPAINKTRRSNLLDSGCFAVWSKNDSIRLNAASGGFCTQMGIETIERGGYVATVLMNNNNAEYILTNDIEELLTSSNSKYVQGNPAGIYRKVRNMLKEGTEVLFNGLPCYCAALLNFLKKDYPNLTTIELICSAPPSAFAVSMALEHSNAKILNQFRKKFKEHHWGGRDHNLVVDNCNIIEQSNTIFYNIFASLMTARKSCMSCKFATLNKVADFAVGDFHGYRCEGYEKGVSLVIANNKTAKEKLLATTGLCVIPATFAQAVNSNHRLYNGYDFVRNHPGVLFRKNLAGTALFYKLCLNKGIYRLFWILFKAVTKAIIKIKHSKAIKTAINIDKRP